VISDRFRAGSTNRESGGTLHPAVQIVQHPLYDYWTIDFDVSVVRVSDCCLLRLTSYQKLWWGPKQYFPTINHTVTYIYHLLPHQKFPNFAHKLIYVFRSNFRVNSDYHRKHCSLNGFLPFSLLISKKIFSSLIFYTIKSFFKVLRKYNLNFTVFSINMNTQTILTLSANRIIKKIVT
jgi:hypothetical protein